MADISKLNVHGTEYNLKDTEARIKKVNLPETNPNGTMDQILRSNGDGTTRWDNAATGGEVSSAVTAWLAEKNTNGEDPIVVDASLTIRGAAADAKVTGDNITDLKSAIQQTAEGYAIVFPVWEKGTIDKHGDDQASNIFYRTVGFLNASTNTEYTFSGRNYNRPIIRWYDENGVYKESTTDITPDANGNSQKTMVALWPKYRIVASSDSSTLHPVSPSNISIAFPSELIERIESVEAENQSIAEDVTTIDGTLAESVNAANLSCGEGKCSAVLEWEPGSIDTSGADKNSSNFVRSKGYLSVSNKKYEYHCATTDGRTIIRMYDANKGILRSEIIETNTETVLDLSGVSYVRFVIPVNTSSCVFYSLIIPYIDAKYNEYVEFAMTGRIPVPAEWAKGSIDTHGDDASSNTLYRTVGYIEAEIGKTYIITATISNGFIVRWYNADKSFAETKGGKNGVSGETQYNEIVAEHPYFRIVNNSADTSTYPPTPGNVKIYKKFDVGINKANYYSTIYGNHTVDCLGDSFTQRTDGWWAMIGSQTGWKMNGYGVSSSRISKDYSSSQPDEGGEVDPTRLRKSFLNRYSEMDTTADCVVIFGGINDCVYLNNGTITMGDMTSPLNSDTFYGALRLLIESIHDSNFMPSCKILGVIPPDFEQDTAHVTWLPLVRAAEREIYKYYGIPYVDLKDDCQEMYESAYNLATYRMIATNNYHPSLKGYKAIGSCILGGLTNLFELSPIVV